MKLRLRTFLIILSDLVFLGLGILFLFLILGTDTFSGNVEPVVIGIAILSLGAAVFLFALLFVARWNSKLNNLAFMNSEYQVANQNFFKRIVGSKIKRRPVGYVVSFYPTLYKDQLILQLGYDKVDTVISQLAIAVKEFGLKHKCIVAYDTKEYFLVYTPKEEFDIEKNIEELEDRFHELLNAEGVFSQIPLAYGLAPTTNEDSIDELIHKANFARLSISTTNPNKKFVYYDENFVKDSISEVELRKDIDRGILNEEFEVYYQPKFDYHINRFVGAEALVKWNHPTKGLMNPGGFIPFAEKSNQIVALDRYIFRHVLQDIASWKKRGIRLLPISINLSRNDAYQTDLIPFIKSIIAEYGVSPQLVEVELTESAISKDIHYITKVLRSIKEIGMKVDMDDFGTGYSSLSMLNKLPLDVMKIDKSFFDDVEIDKRSRDIAKSMISLGKTCGLTIVAEGIETEKQLAFLKTTKCDCVQGYYYSQALTRVEFEKLLKSNKFERKGTTV